MKKNMTKEELEYYNSLSTKEKISYTLKHKSEEEKALAEEKRQMSRSKWSDEYKKEVCNKISKTKLNKSDEEKQEQLEKFRKTISEKPIEEEIERRKKLSEKTRKHFEDMTEDEKESFSKKMSDAYSNMSDKKKRERAEKIKSTFYEKYGDDVYKEMNRQSAEIRSKNCMSKYGVPFYCMIPKAKQSMGGNSMNSKPNQHFKSLLLENNITDFEQEYNIGKYSYDFKINDILVEINPFSTHNSTWSPFDSGPKDKKYHYDKTSIANSNGFRCINVWDWDDIDKIISLLTTRETIYARSCEIREVDRLTEIDFINKYHLQGYTKSSINVGLYYKDILVSIMTFGKPRYNKNYEYELIRYCSSYNVIGGAEKIFSYFVKTYEPNSIISYCDLSKFYGKTYEKLHFSLEKISIGKHWYNPETNVHITDNLLRQQGFDRLLGKQYGTFGKGTSNEQLMLQHGFVEIYDAGQATYIWKSN